MLQDQARHLYESLNPYPGPALDRHCRRIAELTLALGRRWAVELDDDLVHAVAWLHDIGLMVDDPSEPNYSRRGVAAASELIDSWELGAEARRMVHEMLLYNHSLRPLPQVGQAAEMIRRAVWVEHSLGVLRHGLDEELIREVFARFPRRGLTPVLVDFARITIFRDGPAQLLHIFFPDP